MSDIETMVREDPAAALHAVAAGLAGLDMRASTGRTEADLIDVLGELETLKCAAESAQAAATRGVYAAAVARQEAAGVRGSRVGRGIGHQIALARREPPSRGSAHLGLAREVAALPHLSGLWAQGRVTERKVSLILGRIVWLSLDDRRGVDAQLAGDPDRAERLVQMNDYQARGAAEALACAADPAGAVRRRAAAEADRHVTSRPAPDTMMRLSALLPVKESVALIAALQLAAEQARAAGDERNHGQVMADTLVARVTGRDPLTEPAPVSVDVTVPLDALLPEDSHTGQHANAFGWVDGYGEVPADLARSLTADAVETLGVFRRVFTDPTTGQLVAMESTARCFPARGAGPVQGAGEGQRSTHRVSARDHGLASSAVRSLDLSRVAGTRPSRPRRDKLRQASPRLASQDPARPRRHPHRGDHHPHRPHLRNPPTTRPPPPRVSRPPQRSVVEQ